MLKIFGLTILLCLVGIGGSYAWQIGKVRFANDYDSMLKSLYKYTVPLKQPGEIAKDMDKYIFVDTRAIGEYNVCHIPTALWLDYDHPDMSMFDKYPKDQAIVLYCSVGYRSERIGEKLQQKGFKNIINLYGGLFLWFNNNLPVVDKNNEPTQKIHGYSKSWGKWVTRGTTVYE